jgi:hypothetical protein
VYSGNISFFVAGMLLSSSGSTRFFEEDCCNFFVDYLKNISRKLGKRCYFCEFFLFFFGICYLKHLPSELKQTKKWQRYHEKSSESNR